MDYIKLLELNYNRHHAFEGKISRKLFLSEYIFNFTTYDSGMSELFAQKAVEVCEAISNSKTFDYISAADNYKWYLLMCNMPFFNDKLNWGGSIRGAWWDHDEEIILTNIGLWETEEQFTIDLKFTHAQWIEFIAAVINF